MWRGHLCACVNFLAPTDSVSRRQSVDDCVRVVSARRIVNCKMTERIEQRYFIKFCQKFGDTQVETIRKIQQAFGDDAMSITQRKNPSSPRPKKHGRSAATSRFCWPFFSTPVGRCITNTHLKAKQSPKSTTREYFVAFIMLCGANDQTCGQQKLGSAFFASDSRIFG
jgi:hypothetical protein